MKLDEMQSLTSTVNACIRHKCDDFSLAEKLGGFALKMLDILYELQLPAPKIMFNGDEFTYTWQAKDGEKNYKFYLVIDDDDDHASIIKLDTDKIETETNPEPANDFEEDLAKARDDFNESVKVENS